VHVAEWKAELALGFERVGDRTLLVQRASQGPLVVQKPLYPEGPAVCHAIVVHPPGGVAGGDQLVLGVKSEGHALLTTPGAAKWYRSAGPWAKQKLSFDVHGALEWLPRETIVFDGALAELECEVNLGAQARYIGWEIVCLGRTGSGESFSRGRLRMHTRVVQEGKLLWFERGEIEGGGVLMRSHTALGGQTVFGTLVATCDAGEKIAQCRALAPTTSLPGLVVARYLGDSTEAAFSAFASLWTLLRPSVMGREAVPPRIWCT
jgi:urease accessory protein